MRIRLTKPIAQNGRIIPPGVILSDAPLPFMRRLLLQNRAELVADGNAPEAAAVPSPTLGRAKPVQTVQTAHGPVATAKKGNGRRKAVKADG